MFYPQTIEIKPFKVECFSTKTFKFRQYDVIIYDVSADFRILFRMWNSLVMSYPCAKFHRDMVIDNGINCIFHVYTYFWTNDRDLSIMTSLSMTSLILCNYFHI